MRNSLTCITAQDPSLCSRMTRGFRVCAKSIIAGSRGPRCGSGSPSRVVGKLSFVGTDVPTRLVYERCKSSRAATHMMLVRKILLVTSHKISTIAHSFRASHINARGFWGSEFASRTYITAQDPSLRSRMTRGFRVCVKSIYSGL